jgi:mannose-6-phosphate isomerase-like protein (cupin superfamily)
MAILVPPGGGDVVGDSADRRVEILSDDETLAATWSRFSPGREGADLHVHHRHTDLFYVLEGELELKLGLEDERVPIPSGTLARVPPLVVHGFRNGSDAEVRYLNLHAPGEEFAEYLRALRDGRDFSYDQHPPPADGGRPISEAVVGGAAAARDGVTVLADLEEIAVADTVIESAGAPPAHVHRRHLESFYVLEGEVAFRVGDAGFSAQTGSWVQIPPGVPHTLATTGGGPARFLDLHTPGFGLGVLDQEPA